MIYFRNRDFFLLGFLAALIVFGFYFPLLPKFQLTFKMDGSLAEWTAAFATFLAAFIALFGDQIFRSELKIVGVNSLVQVDKRMHEIGYTRLEFHNSGKASAKDITVYIKYIYDDGVLRDNYLPVPLRWTHDGHLSREILAGQKWCLDFCAFDEPNLSYNTNWPKFCLGAGGGIPNFEEIYSKNTSVGLAIYQRQGDVINYKVDLEWIHGEDKLVKVKNIVRE